MIRVIQSAYEYKDYRALLTDDFTIRSERRQSYSLRAYARDLGLSPGYISTLIRGRKHLRRGTCARIFPKLGFTSDEVEFLTNLVIAEAGDNAADRDAASAFVQKRYLGIELEDRSARDGFLRSPEHGMIYGIVEHFSAAKDIYDIAANLEVKSKEVDRILRDLQKEDYLTFDRGEWRCVDQNTAVFSSERLLSFQSELSARVFQLIKHKGGNVFPSRFAQCLTLGFDEQAFEQAIQLYRNFLTQIYRLSQNSQSADRVVFFNSNMFMAQTSPRPSAQASEPEKTPKNT